MYSIDYNHIASGFSKSRKNMIWPEVNYFFQKYIKNLSRKNILDIGCGSGRLLENILLDKNFFYLGLDSSYSLLREAKKNYPGKNFVCLDMIDLEKIGNKKFDFIFFIACFHHLQDINKREIVMNKVKKFLKKDGIIFMTNWALESDLNKEKYRKCCIFNSKNEFGSKDFLIKFSDYYRFYHSFSLKELEFLFKKSGFKIIENRLFENDKNFISIIS